MISESGDRPARGVCCEGPAAAPSGSSPMLRLLLWCGLLLFVWCGGGCVSWRSDTGEVPAAAAAAFRGSLPIRVESDGFVPGRFSVSAGDADEHRLSLDTAGGADGVWSAALLGSPYDPQCLRLRVSGTEADRVSGVDVLFRWASGGDDGSQLTPLFATQLVDGRPTTQTWDIQVASAGGALTPVDREAAVLWARDHLEALSDIGFIMTLSDTIWHNHSLDRPPGSFNDIIRFHHRILEIDPSLADVYSTIAWLLWSKWVTWTRQPEKMPDGESKLEEALAVLARGAEANPQDPGYAYEAARVLTPVVRFHRPDLSATVLDYLTTAYRLEQDPARQIRIRLDIAHQHRHAGRTREAVQWYRRVLEIDPDQTVARQYLSQLSNAASPAEE